MMLKEDECKIAPEFLVTYVSQSGSAAGDRRDWDAFHDWADQRLPQLFKP